MSQISTNILFPLTNYFHTPTSQQLKNDQNQPFLQSKILTTAFLTSTPTKTQIPSTDDLHTTSN